MNAENTVQQTGLFWFRKLSKPENESFVHNFIEHGKAIGSTQPIKDLSKYLNEPCDNIADFFSGAFPLGQSPEGREFWDSLTQKYS
jgi:hypothetical protein